MTVESTKSGRNRIWLGREHATAGGKEPSGSSRRQKKAVRWILTAIVLLLAAVVVVMGIVGFFQLNRLRSTVDQQKAQLSSMDASLKTQQSQNEALQQENDTLRSELQAKDQQIEALKKNGTPMVALTFDDGPGPYTARLLDILKAHNAKATFFLVGTRIPGNPSVLKRMESEGHAIGNHGYSHTNLTRLTAAQVNTELEKCNRLIRQQVGHNAVAMRAPGGNSNQTVRNCAASAGMPIIYWSVDTRDWSSRNKNKILEVAFGSNSIRDGSIVLMHDIYSTTVDAVEEIIKRLEKQNYVFVTVPELLAARKGGSQPGEVYVSGYPS